MCYDISFSTTIEMITDYLPDIIVDPQISFDFTSEENIHVVAQAHARYPLILFENGRYHLKEFAWGIIADYMNTPEQMRTRSWMCNAQSERILLDTTSYWYRIRHQRCLIPVNATFEHRHISGWKNKVPYLIRIKGRELFCLPGIFNYASDPGTGSETGTFSLITRPANELMRQIHNGGDNPFRMPLFLRDREMELKWLHPGLPDGEMQDILDYELPSEALEYWTTYTIRSPRPRPDGKRKTDPYKWPGLPPLGKDDGRRKENLLFG